MVKAYPCTIQSLKRLGSILNQALPEKQGLKKRQNGVRMDLKVGPQHLTHQGVLLFSRTCTTAAMIFMSPPFAGSLRNTQQGLLPNLNLNLIVFSVGRSRILLPGKSMPGSTGERSSGSGWCAFFTNSSSLPSTLRMS